MAEESDLEKTEPPSEQRLSKAREDGKVPQSRELSTFLVLIAGVLGLWVTWRWMYSRLGGMMQEGLVLDREDAFSTRSMITHLTQISADGLLTLAPLFVILAIASVASPLMLGGILFSGKALMPDPSRLSLPAGLGRMFSVHGLVELIKGLLKAVLIGTVAVLVLRHFKGGILALPGMELEAAVGATGEMMLWATLFLVMSLMLLALIDVPFQLWQYYDRLKMSKQDVKQEQKEQEGDPQIKGQIRARQREMARRRMMDAVPTADVVVTNPTHFAVALKYEAGSMSAPQVVAKGADLIAHNIRELARKNGVPLLEAPPLARALYRHAEVGDAVPAALYTAVAEVMAYIYSLNHFLSTGGLPPEQPHAIAVPADLDPATLTPTV